MKKVYIVENMAICEVNASDLAEKYGMVETIPTPKGIQQKYEVLDVCVFVQHGKVLSFCEKVKT